MGSAVSYFSWSATHASPASLPSVTNPATSALKRSRNMKPTAVSVRIAVMARTTLPLWTMNAAIRSMTLFSRLVRLPEARAWGPGQSRS